MEKEPLSLDSMYLFEGVGPEALAMLALEVEEISCLEEEVIVEEGTFGNHLYVIAQGSVRVVMRLGREQETELAVLKERDFFGEMCLLENVLRCASVQAVEPVVLYSLSRVSWHRFAESWPEEHAKVVMNTARDLSKRLRVLDEAFLFPAP